MKKKVPLNVLEILEPYVDKEGQNYFATDPGTLLMRFKDKDSASDFFFNIVEYKSEGVLKLLIDYKPHSKLTTSNFRVWIEAKFLQGHFESWSNLLERYSTVKSVFDDPVIEHFSNNYYSEFEIIGNDANTAPFSPNQILMLDSYLEEIELNLDKHKTNENETQLEEIKLNVIELRNDLTKKPKSFVIKKLCGIWAKLTKQGTKFLKEFLSEARKELIKQGVKYVIEKGPELLQ